MAKTHFGPTTRKVGWISMMVVSIVVFILIFGAIIEVFITRSKILKSTDKVFNTLEKPFNIVEKAAKQTNDSLELTSDSISTIKSLSTNPAIAAQMPSQITQILQESLLPETKNFQDRLANIANYADQFTANAELLSAVPFLSFAKDNFNAVGEVSTEISDYSKSTQDFLQSIDKLKVSDASSPEFLVNLDKTNKYVKDVQEGTSEFENQVKSMHQRLLDLKKEIHSKVNWYSVLMFLLLAWLVFSQVVVFIYGRAKLKEI